MTRHDASAHELVENLRFSSPAHVVEEGRPAAIHMYWYMCCDTVQVSGGAQRFRLQSYAKAADRVLCCSRHCFAAKEKIQSCLSTINRWLCARRLKGGDLRLSHRIQARQRIHTPSGLLGNVTTRSQHLTNWRGESRRRELWGKKLECAASRREKKVKRGNARTESPVRPLAVARNSGLKCCR